jgi:hypothetical protein
MHPLPLLIVLGLSTPALAAPDLIPLQGNLRTRAGDPVDGTRPVTFRMYGDPDKAQTVWTSTQDVVFQAGNFTAYLGQDGTLDLDLFRDTPDIWLGITVDGDELPLTRLGSVAYAGYARHAGDADTLEGFASEDFFAAVPSRADIESYALGVCLDNEAELTALLDDNYTYVGGTGIDIAANVVSVVESDLVTMLDDTVVPATVDET